MNLTPSPAFNYHISRVPVLPLLPVDATDNVDLVRVGEARLWDELADGAGGIKTLCHRPRVSLLLGLVLKVPGGHVKRKHVPDHVVHDLGLRDVFAPLSYDDAQLDLVVNLLAAERNLQSHSNC
jgi:hypothetical protein